MFWYKTNALLEFGVHHWIKFDPDLQIIDDFYAKKDKSFVMHTGKTTNKKNFKTIQPLQLSSLIISHLRATE